MFSLAFGLVLLLYKHKQSEKGHMEITSPDEDKTTENNHKSTELLPEIQQHGSAVDNRENPVHQATGKWYYILWIHENSVLFSLQRRVEMI